MIYQFLEEKKQTREEIPIHLNISKNIVLSSGRQLYERVDDFLVV